MDGKYRDAPDDVKAFVDRETKDTITKLIHTLRDGGVPDGVIARNFELVLRNNGFMARVYR